MSVTIFGSVFVFLFFMSIFLLWDGAHLVGLPIMFVSLAGLSFYSFALHSAPLTVFFSGCCILFVLAYWVLSCKEGREL